MWSLSLSLSRRRRLAVAALIGLVGGVVSVLAPEPKPAVAAMTFNGPGVTQSNSFDAAEASSAGLPVPLQQIIGGIVPNTLKTLAGVINTVSLRPAEPSTGPPHVRIMLISSGVEPSALPFGLRSMITGDSKDTYGLGTWAASVILSLLPDAAITSRNAGPGLVNLYANLNEVAANPSDYDVVLIALNPAMLLEPSAAMAQAGVGAIGQDPVSGEVITGSRWDQLQEAILKHPGIGSDGSRVIGIPTDPTLRERVFATAKGKERAAVEYAVARQASWDQIKAKIRTIYSEGVPIFMPAGDWQQGAAAKPVVGLSTLPEVITVGASYQGASGNGDSPISAIGTLGYRSKPDMWSNTNVAGVTFGSADPCNNSFYSTYGAAWRTLRFPEGCAGGTNQVGDIGTVSADFPSLPGCDYGCLPSNAFVPTPQGSSIVAAAVAAAQMGHLVAQNWPLPASGRAVGLANDGARIARGVAWAYARGGLPSTPPLPTQSRPILLERPWFGALPWNTTRSVTVPLWTGGALPMSATIASGSLPSGVTGEVSFAGAAMTLDLTTTTPRGQAITPIIQFGGSVTAMAEALLGVDMKITASHPFLPDPARTASDPTAAASVVLLPGLPEGTGPFSGATSWLPPDIADLPIRTGFTDPSGVAVIQGVVPGFYRIFLLDDHGAVAEQPANPNEGLGPVLSGGGISGIYINGSIPCEDFPVANCNNQGGPAPSSATRAVAMCEDSYSTAGYTRPIHVYCGGASILAPTGVFTRSVHLPQFTDLVTCSASVPVGSTTPLSSACTNTTNAWGWSAHAADCASDDALPDPTNPNSDSATAVYNGSVPLSPVASYQAPTTLPVTVMKYTFDVPQPGSDLDVTVGFAYHISNAIAVLNVTAGDQGSVPFGPLDQVSAVIMTRDPHVTIDPGLSTRNSTGSVAWHTALVAGGATKATFSITVIPTTWVSAAPLGSARFEICNLGIRSKPFARQIWRLGGSETTPRLRSIPLQIGHLNTDMVTETDPSRCRTRKAWIADPAAPDYHTFRSLGDECEQAWAAFEVPKDDGATDPKFHVPAPGTAASYLSDVQGNSSLVGAMLAGGAKLYDPERGTHLYNCTPPPLPDRSDLAVTPNPSGALDQSGNIDALCLARAEQQYQILFPDLRTNGKYMSTLGIGDPILRSIARVGNTRTVTPWVKEAPDPFCPGAQCPVFPYAVDCATGQRYTMLDANNNRVPDPDSPCYVPGPPIGTYFEPERHPELNGVSSDVAAGAIAIGIDGSPTTLWITINTPQLGQHTIETDLNCIVLDNGSEQCRPS